MKKVGFTTSIPVEILYAAGLIPVDLNNIFITGENPAELVEKAENDGFPRNTCAWIKGIYSSILKNSDIDTIISVVEGDCSNTRALKEVLEMKGVRCIPFSYRTQGTTATEIKMKTLCPFWIKLSECLSQKKNLHLIRGKLKKSIVSHGKLIRPDLKNHLWQFGRDFNGDFDTFDSQLSERYRYEKEPTEKKVRLDNRCSPINAGFMIL